MEITSFLGFWFVVVIFLTFYKGAQGLLLSLIFFCPFQASSVLNFGDKSLSPFLLSEIVALFWFIPRIRRWKKDSSFFPLFALVIVAAASVFFLPSLFRGMIVYLPSQGLDDAAVFGGSPLVPTASNYVQVLYLLIHVGVLFVFRSVGKFDLLAFNKVLIFSFLIVSLICLWQYLSFLSPIPYSDDFFHGARNIAKVEMATPRLYGVFNEASVSGGFFAAAMFAFFAVGGGFYILLGLAFGAGLLTVSSTWAGTISVMALLVFLKKILSKGSLTKRLLLFSFVVFVAFVLYPLLNSFISSFVDDKLVSSSGVNRTQSNLDAWSIFLNTYGLGVGLGSNRPSSFLLFILSNVGILGFIFYTLFAYKLVKRAFIRASAVDVKPAIRTSVRAYIVFCIAMVLAQIIALPDLNIPMTWAGFFMLAGALNYMDRHGELKSANKPMAKSSISLA